MPSFIGIMHAMQRRSVIGKLISSHLGEKLLYTRDPILIAKMTCVMRGMEFWNMQAETGFKTFQNFNDFPTFSL
jgi:hypothetical protein